MVTAPRLGIVIDTGEKTGNRCDTGLFLPKIRTRGDEERQEAERLLKSFLPDRASQIRIYPSPAVGGSPISSFIPESIEKKAWLKGRLSTVLLRSLLHWLLGTAYTACRFLCKSVLRHYLILFSSYRCTGYLEPRRRKERGKKARQNIWGWKGDRDGKA